MKLRNFQTITDTAKLTELARNWLFKNYFKKKKNL